MTLESKGLSEKDQKILDYIKSHPGSTKTAVVNGLDGVYSRVTVLNTIKRLVNYGLVEEHKDKPNSQTHHLRINDKNEFNTIDQELSEIEKIIGEMNVVIDKIYPELRAEKNDKNWRLSTLDMYFVTPYLMAFDVMIRFLLIRISKSSFSERDTQLLYARVAKCFLELDLQIFKPKKERA